MKMTISQQVSKEAFRTKDSKKCHNGKRLDLSLTSSARQGFLTKVNIADAQKPFSMNLNKIKNKYMLLNPSHENNVQKPSSGDVTEIANDGIPSPKYVLFPSDKVEQSWKTCMRAGAGLVNLGNTCFLNSALQCLTYTPPLANYLLHVNHKNHCKTNGQFCMLCALQNHINSTLNNSGQAIKPMGILKNLRSIAKHMHFGRQEDAHEFIRYSVDAMQKSCLHGHSSKLDMHTKATTLVHRVFGGYLRSRVKCGQCKAVSDTFDPFLDVSLDINKQGCSDLRRCLEHFVTAEILQGDDSYKCYRCKNSVSASKTFSIHRSPNVLTIQLKRFSSFIGSKIKKDVTFPCKLNLGPYTSSSHKEGPWYELYAVLVHSGFSCQSGHYYAYAKAANGQWYCFNDSSVRQVTTNQVLSEQAYLLFYHKVANLKRVSANILNKSTVSSAREPILHVLNKEISHKSISTNGLKVSSNSPNSDYRVKLHTSAKSVKLCSGKQLAKKRELEKDQNLFSKFNSIAKTDNLKLYGLNKKTVCAPSAGTSSSKCPYPSAGDKPSVIKTASVSGTSVNASVLNGKSVGAQSKPSMASKMVEKSDSSSSPKHQSCVISKVSSPTPCGRLSTDTIWLEKKLREKYTSPDSRRKSHNQSKSLISFKIKSFSKLNQHQKHNVRKHHSTANSLSSIREAYSYEEDSLSSSSSDSCHSDKDVTMNGKSLKLLGKHKSPHNGDLDEGQTEEAPSCSPAKKLKLQTICHSAGASRDNYTKDPLNEANDHHSSATRWDEKRGKDKKEHSNILSELIEQSSIKAYSTNLSAKDDTDSCERKKDYLTHDRSKIDGRDEKDDYRSSKSVKSKLQTNRYFNSDLNLFQKFQKLDS